MLKLNILFLSFFILINSLYAQQRVNAKDIELQTKYLEARNHLEIGKTDKAIEILEGLYKDNRTNASISFELAKIYATKKDFASVEKYGENAIKNAPQNEWMVRFYADYMLSNNRPETAIKLYDQLITLKPNTAEYYEKKVDGLIKLNRPQEAIACYQALELKNGPSVDTYLERFDIYDNMGDKTSALIELEKLIAFAPLEKKYLKIKAGFLKKHGDANKSKDTYAQVLKIDPNDVEANVAMLVEQSGNDKSDAYLRSLIPIVSDPSVPLDSKIKELIPYIQSITSGKDLQLLDALKEVGNKLILAHPSDAKAHAAYGDILMAAHDTNLAISQYEKTLSLDDKKYAVWRQIMYALYDSGQMAQLKTYATKAIDLFPNESESFFFATQVEIYNKQFQDALSLANEATMIAANNKNLSSLAYTALGLAYLANGDKIKAKEAIEKALSLSDHKNNFAFEALGDIAKYNKDKSAAKEAWLTAQGLGNNSKRLLTKLASESN